MKARPQVTVGALILKAGKVLLVKRAKAPFKGYWCLPGGHLKWGEKAADGIKREVKEETSLDFKPSFFCYQDEIIPSINWHAEVLFFKGKAKGKPMPGSDASAVNFFSLKRLPKKIAFYHRELIKKCATK